MHSSRMRLSPNRLFRIRKKKHVRVFVLAHYQNTPDQADRSDRAFSAFPDSNSAAHVGDSTFTFRMRSGHFTSELYRTQQAPPLAMDNSASMALPGRGMSTLHPGAGLPVDTDGFTYGYVFFRQQKDSEIRRGYFQVSEPSCARNGFFIPYLTV